MGRLMMRESRHSSQPSETPGREMHKLTARVLTDAELRVLWHADGEHARLTGFHIFFHCTRVMGETRQCHGLPSPPVGYQGPRYEPRG
jgi:hypothetical protein